MGTQAGSWLLEHCFSWRCPGAKETLLSLPLGLEPEPSHPAFISKTVPGTGGNLQAPALRNPSLPAGSRARSSACPGPAVTEHSPCCSQRPAWARQQALVPLAQHVWLRVGVRERGWGLMPMAPLSPACLHPAVHRTLRVPGRLASTASFLSPLSKVTTS